MDYLWSPWRYAYVSSVTDSGRCVFCIDDTPERDQDRLVLYRARYNFVIMNLYPYTSGHLMVAPYRHVASVVEADPDQMEELIGLCRRAVQALEEIYRPEGFNIGMNLGHSAGAGVRDHLHMHVVPRWLGDSNFMTVTGETRVLPESLEGSYARLKPSIERVMTTARPDPF